MKICVAVLAVVLAVGYIEYTKAEDHETESGSESKINIEHCDDKMLQT